MLKTITVTFAAGFANVGVMDTNTGGPAFPTSDYLKGNPVSAYFTGLTVRDLFAAAALSGLATQQDALLANHELIHQFGALGIDKLQASKAYRLADAMLKERMKCQ